MVGRWIKRIFPLAALCVVIYLFLPLVGEIRGALALFAHARWGWLGAALLLEAVSYSCLTWLNQLSLRPFPGHIGFARLTALLTSIAFIEVAVPSASASGVALRARLLGRHGYSVAASTFTLLLETLFLSIAMGCVGVLGMTYVLEHGQFTPSSLLALAAVALSLIALIATTWAVAVHRERSERLARWGARLWNRVAGRRRRVEPAALAERAAGFRESLLRLQSMPAWMFILAAFGRVVLDTATLGVCFNLFGGNIDVIRLFTGYGLTLLLSGLAALPGGLGVADASLPVVFSRLGVPGPVALAAGLTYRLLAFWLVRFAGFVSWQMLEARS